MAPTIAPHARKHDITLNGFVIPKEVTLIIDLDSINMDPEVFPDPFSFNLEGFLSEDGKVIGTEKIGAFLMGRNEQKHCITITKENMDILKRNLLQPLFNLNRTFLHSFRSASVYGGICSKNVTRFNHDVIGSAL